MEIALKIENWSYYVQSKAIYCNGTVLEKRIIDNKNEHYHHFQSISKTQKIALKYIQGQPQSVLKTLEEINVIVHVTGIENSSQQKVPSLKFYFDSVKPCAILADAL